MRTDFQFDGSPAPDGGGDAVERTRRDRYHLSARSLESREAEFAARLQARQQSADELRGRHLARLDGQEQEYRADRARTRQELDQARVHLKAAHHAASEHCGEVGVRYVPGETTDEDVLRVPLMEQDQAARRLGLPFGAGFSDRLVKFLKPLLTLLCWLMAALSLGLAFRLLDARNVFGNPPAVGLALVMGGVVAVGLVVALTSLWKPLGTKMGAGRPAAEVRGMFVPVAAITAVLLLGLAFLDAKALILLNAARAALDPSFAIPMSVGLLIGGVISGVYALGLAGTAFADGYNAAARQSIDALVRGDENDRREAVKRRVPVRRALEALAGVKVAEEIIRGLDGDLRRLDQAFKQGRAELVESLPDRPTTLEPDEAQELADLRDHVRSAKAHHDSYAVSQGAAMTNNGTNNQ